MQSIADQRWFVLLLVAGEAQNYMGNRSQDYLEDKEWHTVSLLELQYVSGCATWGNFGWMGIWCPYGKSRSEKCFHVDQGQENIIKWVWFIHPYHLPYDLFCFFVFFLNLCPLRFLLITSFTWPLIWATIMKVQQIESSYSKHEITRKRCPGKKKVPGCCFLLNPAMFEVNCRYYILKKKKRYCKTFVFVFNRVSWTPNFSVVFY